MYISLTLSPYFIKNYLDNPILYTFKKHQIFTYCRKVSCDHNHDKVQARKILQPEIEKQQNKKYLLCEQKLW